jgi:tetratricopeptide (TPR) repeat protein
MRYYEDALRVQRNLDNPAEYATLLNNIGNVLRLLGKLEDALRYCKLGLRMRRDLARQGKASQHGVGLSLSTLGHIYHNLGAVNEEEKAYKEAFEIYSRIGNRRDIAAVYNNLARVQVSRGNIESATEGFHQALRIASGVYDVVAIESYNHLGRIALTQEEWETARAHFQRAVTLARGASVNFELAENLLYLAQAFENLDQPAQAFFKEGKRIARKFNYSYLLAVAGEIQGDLSLKRVDYLSAFKHYGTACRYMAERSTPEFNRILRKVNDRLLDIPSDYLPGVIDVLRSYWTEFELDEKYPQLSIICKEVSRHMLL